LDDKNIIELFHQKDETGLTEINKKYHNYCYSIAYNILRDKEDTEECVNDTFLRAWDAIPPAFPEKLSVFVGTITRQLALNLYQKKKASKRGYGEVCLAFEELEEVIPDHNNSITNQ
jgi:RNA polymerase sigma-70 factor (ECF subfamily)